jgi:hypothetical protein
MTNPVTLDEFLTYWEQVGNDGGDGIRYAPGVTVPARHSDVQEKVETGNGREIMSKFAFYTETDLQMGARVVIDIAQEHTGATVPTGPSRPVIARSRNPMFELTRVLV